MLTQLRSLTHSRAARARVPKQLRAAITFIAVAFLSFAGLAGWRAWEERQTELAQTQVAAANLARSLVQHTEDTVRLADTLLTGIVERAETLAGDDDALARLHLLFQRHISETPQLEGLFLFDAKGHYLASSFPSMPSVRNLDRAYFQHHMHYPDRNAYVGPPVKSRTTGDWVVTISKRIDHMDGRFAGVALATFKMDYFISFQQDFDIGPGGVMLIALEDGRILTRRPFDETVIGTPVEDSLINPSNFSARPVGSFAARSRPDGAERIYSYRYLDDYPLVAIVGLSYKDALARWRTSMLTYAVSLLSLGLLLAFLGWRLFDAIRIALQSERKLIEAHASLKRLNRTLESMALQDALTGLANRRQFDSILETEYRRALRSGMPVSVMMLDVDYFKQYNDVYGHPQGDRCLKSVSAALTYSIGRAGDLVARYGGEEFSILLPNTDLASAEALAQRVCHAIEQLAIPHGGSPFGKVTVSIGVASLMPASGIAHQMSHQGDLVHAADRALYIAKRDGRNQVCATDRKVCEVFDAEEDKV